MGVRSLKPRGPSPVAEELKRELVHEWQHPRQNAQPMILTEETGPYRAVHIYVVWDKWEGLSQLERSEVIMDAYEELDLYGNRNITLAMGLTPQEADRMGIKYG